VSSRRVEKIDSSRLQAAILGYPLPFSTLVKPRNLLFQIWALATAIRLFLRLPFGRVESLFPAAGEPVRAEPDLERAAISWSLTEAILRSRILPLRRTCLRRCLLLSHLLRRSGLEVFVAFGVDPLEAGWEGHSWLTLQGRPFLEGEEERRTYAPIFTLPRGPEGGPSEGDHGIPT
jgi:hypothetical protein